MYAHVPYMYAHVPYMYALTLHVHVRHSIIWTQTKQRFCTNIFVIWGVVSSPRLCRWNTNLSQHEDCYAVGD